MKKQLPLFLTLPSRPEFAEGEDDASARSSPFLPRKERNVSGDEGSERPEGTRARQDRLRVACATKQLAGLGPCHALIERYLFNENYSIAEIAGDIAKDEPSKVFWNTLRFFVRSQFAVSERIQMGTNGLNRRCPR